MTTCDCQGLWPHGRKSEKSTEVVRALQVGKSHADGWRTFEVTARCPLRQSGLRSVVSLWDGFLLRHYYRNTVFTPLPRLRDESGELRSHIPEPLTTTIILLLILAPIREDEDLHYSSFPSLLNLVLISTLYCYPSSCLHHSH